MNLLLSNPHNRREKSGKVDVARDENNEKEPSMNHPRAATSAETLCLNADHLSLREIGPWLAELVNGFQIDEGDLDLDAVELAVHEIAMNIVDHAFGDRRGSLTISGTVADGSLIIRTIDRGTRFQPSAYVPPRPDHPQVGGYGLFLAEQLADSLRYERSEDENRWEMVFTRASLRL